MFVRFTLGTPFQSFWFDESLTHITVFFFVILVGMVRRDRVMLIL